MLEVLLTHRTSFLRQGSIEVLGDAVPDMFAIYDHGNDLLFNVRVAFLN